MTRVAPVLARCAVEGCRALVASVAEADVPVEGWLCEGHLVAFWHSAEGLRVGGILGEAGGDEMGEAGRREARVACAVVDFVWRVAAEGRAG